MLIRRDVLAGGVALGMGGPIAAAAAVGGDVEIDGRTIEVSLAEAERGLAPVMVDEDELVRITLRNDASQAYGARLTGATDPLRLAPGAEGSFLLSAVDLNPRTLACVGADGHRVAVPIRIRPVYQGHPQV